MIFFMRTKIFAILIFIFVINFKSFSQTYVGLTIGADFSTIHPKYIVDQHIFYTVYRYNTYKFSSFSPGIIIEQKLGKYFSLDINSSITKKKLEITKEQNIHIIEIPYFDYKFTYIKNSICLKIYPISYFYIGVGGNYNFSDNFVYTFGSGGKSESYIGDFEEFGWLFSCGFRYNNFFIDANFSKPEKNIHYLKGGISKFINGPFNFTNSSLKPIDSYMIQFGYLFKIINAPKFERGNSVKCPKF